MRDDATEGDLENVKHLCLIKGYDIDEGSGYIIFKNRSYILETWFY